MTYRFYNPAPVLHDLLGIDPCAGGSLAFFDRGTTTPRLTWADADQTVPNPNPVPLDSSGRVNNNVWLDGAYSVVLKDAAGATVWTRDVDSGSGAGQAIPTLITGQFLTNDGSNLAWAPIAELPDPTGAEGYQLEVASGIPAWVPKPEPPVIPDPDIDVQTGSARIGGLLIQWGTATAPPTGDYATFTSVNFPMPFAAPPVFVKPQLTMVRATVSSLLADSVTSASATGCTFNFVVADSKEKTTDRIVNTINFNWMAIGLAP